jgi:hypothetical protein
MRRSAVWTLPVLCALQTALFIGNAAAQAAPPAATPPPAIAATPPAAAATTTTAAATPPAPQFAIELNKVETVAGTCTAYFIVRNATADLLTLVNVQVYVFDTPGQIQGAFTLPFADIRPNSEKVGVFQLAQGDCAAIGRVLINDIADCQGPGGAPIAACGAMFTVSSRATIMLQY